MRRRLSYTPLLLLSFLQVFARADDEELTELLRKDECPQQSLELLQKRKQQQLQKLVNKPPLIKGISYGPSPLVIPGKLGRDDFFCDDAKPMWGPKGRGDLHIMKLLGANTVRLYGNDPSLDHLDFLDYANLEGLSVIPGNGDAAFYGESCKGSGSYSCAEGVKAAYLRNLHKGFLKKVFKGGFYEQVGEYHPSISMIIVVNEPELKFPGLDQPKSWAKLVATAIDGMLGAEDEAGVNGTKPNFTATFSFAHCTKCGKFGNMPGLGQMWEVRNAMLHPEQYGIKSKHNLPEFFRTRFTFSFNSGNPSHEIQNLFLAPYEKEFPTTPIFIGEYHNPGNPDNEKDIKNMLRIADESALLLGLNFFEWQNRYDEAGHLIWGMFDPQDLPGTDLPHVKVRDERYRVPCLAPVFQSATFNTIPEQIALAFNGSGINVHRSLCEPSPLKVQVSQHGFDQIKGLKNATTMGAFITRVVKHMGGFLPYGVPKDFAQVFIKPYETWENLEVILRSRPSWINFDNSAACVADHSALKADVGNIIGYVCGLGYVDCSTVPKECKVSVFDTANFVLGTHFKRKSELSDKSPKPLSDCHFDGLAKFVSSADYLTFSNASQAAKCIVPIGKPDPESVFVSPHGMNQIHGTQNKTAMKVFISRAVKHSAGHAGAAQIPDQVVESALSSNATFSSMSTLLSAKPEWASWSSIGACVPNFGCRASDVGAKIGEVCSKGVFDCSEIPERCKSSVWNTAAFAFGSYFKNSLSHNNSIQPLVECNIGGFASFVAADVYETLDLDQQCVVHIKT